MKRGVASIAGLGITPMGKIYGKSASDFAADAIALALEDSGLKKADLDGLIVCASTSPEMNPFLQMTLGLTDLRLLQTLNAFGSTAGTAMAYAAAAIDADMASTIAVVFADAPLGPSRSASAAYATRAGVAPMGALKAANGEFGATHGYALATQRHMHQFGTTHEQLATIAIGQREWAMKNPLAQLRAPLTREEYHASRYITEPLHLYDCCLVSNGAVAVIVTSRDRARDLPQPPVHLLGFGQGAPGDNQRDGRDPGLYTGATMSGERALRMAGVSLQDIQIRELYDCYTYTVLVTLEDYGYCAKGEGGEFVSDGKLGPGGSLPTNTGGGQLSSYYMWGFTPLSEAVIQARGQGGDRQVPQHDLILVSGNGGVLNYHSTTIVGTEAAL
jgi:acetyl-CoA acetyltransferase